tara:strand:- start:478 stop:702 length:225 start_codon:yes stop_codon:yes gene_type:complete
MIVIRCNYIPFFFGVCFSILVFKMKNNKSFFYFAVAGVIGSFNVVSENGWLYLIPFWVVIFLLSKIVDYLLNKF